MVIDVIFLGSWGLNQALKPVLGAIVRICNGHYIWCLASAQATTGSVPGSFVSFLELHQIIL
jgi:hypothetical protein